MPPPDPRTCVHKLACGHFQSDHPLKRQQPPPRRLAALGVRHRRDTEKRRAAHILTGKVYCGCCGGTMTNVGRDYLGCNVARKQGICANVQSTRRSELEALVMDALRTRLMAPELVADFVRSFTAEWNRAAAEASAGRDGVVRELATVQRKLNGLISALADGFRAAGLQAQLDALETKRIELSGKLAAPAPAQPRLHPNIAQVYRDKVERLQEALQADSGGQAALEAVRALIDRVVLTPAAGGRGFEIELIGEIASMISKRCFAAPLQRHG